MAIAKETGDFGPYAGRDGTNTLYRYMRYPSGPGGEESRRRVLALIQKGELYFPRAEELNDPFEASPRFRVPQTLPDLLSGHLVWSKRNGLSQEAIDRGQVELTASFESGNYQVGAEITLMKYRRLFRNVLLCSFSATRSSTLMWSYYADGHKGICIHFQATEPAPFAAALGVAYEKEYPIVQVLKEGQGLQLMRVAFLTKSQTWEHEKEYRLVNISRDGEERADSPRIFDDFFRWRSRQLAVTQPRYICGVTVGACMESAEIEEVMRACFERLPRIEHIEQARPRSDRFDLEFARV